MVGFLRRSIRNRGRVDTGWALMRNPTLTVTIHQLHSMLSRIKGWIKDDNGSEDKVYYKLDSIKTKSVKIPGGFSYINYNPATLPPASDRHTRFVMISDTHAQTFPLPDGDVLIHAGDLSIQGLYDELDMTASWLYAAPHRVKVVIAGNHDTTLDNSEPNMWYDNNWRPHYGSEVREQ